MGTRRHFSYSTQKSNQEPAFKRWKTRFSAGGANRTNVHNIIRDLSYEHLGEAPIRSHRLPYDRYSYKKDAAGERVYSPSHYYDEKGRPLQRVGLFRNSKHSDLVLPNVNEEVLRNVGTKKKSIRNRVRQVVQEMAGIPAEPAFQRFVNPTSHRRLFDVSPVARYTNPHQNVLYDSGYEPRYENTRYEKYRPSNDEYYESQRVREDDEYMDDRRGYQRRSTPRTEEDDSDDDDGELRRRRDRRNRRIEADERKRRRRRNVFDNKSPARDLLSVASPMGIRRSLESKRRHQSYPNQRNVDSAATNSDYEEESAIPMPNKVGLSNSDLDQYFERRQKFGRKREKKYIIDEANESWRKALGFMNDRNGDGMLIVRRMGASLPMLPLREDSQKCYSKVASLLIRKSIKNAADREKSLTTARSKPSVEQKSASKIYNELVDMSTILAAGGDFEPKSTPSASHKSIFHDISKIRNPQRFLGDDCSKFEANSVIFKRSNDVIRSSEFDLMPSSIRNTELNDSEDLIDPKIGRDYTEENIEKGASLLTFIDSPDVGCLKSNFEFEMSPEPSKDDPFGFEKPIFEYENPFPDETPPNSALGDDPTFRRMFNNAYKEHQTRKKLANPFYDDEF
ncbi:unnamed protein product [Caenorhabditis bovis]|uniref:Uncharacterized protein n=1 Tax=Caenorhabditis bovis TaxID=2654633 RepID=A0A8S1FDR6_9PELO|nr:unnamed protein product [Caenorhabditis bovis]